MSEIQAKAWIEIEFTPFYLRDKVYLILDSLNENNFVSSLSDFVNDNKSFAEEEIKKNHTPEEAEQLIVRLSGLNYEFMKNTYFTLYNTSTPNILSMNTLGIEYMEWLQADVNTLKRYAPDIFAGGLDLNKDTTKLIIQAALKAISELQEDIDMLKTQLELLSILQDALKTISG